jgi:hypothetical protein
MIRWSKLKVKTTLDLHNYTGTVFALCSFFSPANEGEDKWWKKQWSTGALNFVSLWAALIQSKGKPGNNASTKPPLD